MVTGLDENDELDALDAIEDGMSSIEGGVLDSGSPSSYMTTKASTGLARAPILPPHVKVVQSCTKTMSAKRKLQL